MAKPDPFLNLLKDIGFIPLRLPRADAEPLNVLSINGKDFSLLGDLQNALSSPVAMPPLTKDIATAGQIQGTETSKVKLSIGLDILGKILQALTNTKLDVSAAFMRAATLTFAFNDVTVDKIDVILLDQFLNRSDINANAGQVRESLIEGKLAVVTAAARTKKYTVSAQDESGIDVTVDVPVIKEIASGNLGVSTSGSSNKNVTFDGPNPVTFGVQGIRVFFDENGKFTAFNPLSAGSGAVRALGAAAAGVPELIAVDGVFANIS